MTDLHANHYNVGIVVNMQVCHGRDLGLSRNRVKAKSCTDHPQMINHQASSTLYWKVWGFLFAYPDGAVVNMHICHARDLGSSTEEVKPKKCSDHPQMINHQVTSTLYHQQFSSTSRNILTKLLSLTGFQK